MSGGKRGIPVAVIDSLRISSLYPLDPATAVTMGLKAPFRTFETYTSSTDEIRNGDILVIESKEYPIISAELWNHRIKFYRLIVQEVLA